MSDDAAQLAYAGEYDKGRYAAKSFDTTTEEFRRKHQIMTGKALNLLERVVDKGGSEDEIRRASEFLLVAMDCVKHNLNPYKAGEILKIGELVNKYPRESMK